jgi:cytochrome c-type biogenesis protein CcmH
MKALVLLIVLLLTGLTSAGAVEPGERLADPALEARARTISSQLRCLVCQNESIDESGAGLAHDIRIFVRARLVSGETDRQVVNDVVSRYGTFVLLDPPVRPATYLLWYGPPGLLLLALGGALLWLRNRSSASLAGPTALTDAEHHRLQDLLKDR